MEKDTKSFEHLDFLVSHIIASQHRRSKNKWVNLYPTAEADQAFHTEAFAFLCDILAKRAIASKDSIYILSLFQKCLKGLKDANEVTWKKALEVLGIFIKRQRLEYFLYEEKSEIDRVIVDILRNFPKEFLGNALKNSKNYVEFHTLCKFFYLEKDLKAHSDVVIAKLKEEFLVDRSKLNVRLTKYISKSILDDAMFEELLTSGIKLIKRSEANMETLTILLENTTIDISKRAYSLLFEDLKDLLGDKEKISKLHTIFKAVIKQVKDVAVLDKIFQELIKLVQTNNQEPLKVAILQLMFYMVKLDNNELPKTWIKSLLGIVTASANLITGDDTTPILTEELRKLRSYLLKKENVVVGLDDKDITNFKKLLTNATLNKNSLSTISTVMTYLLDFEREENAGLTKEITAIIDTAYQNNVAANIKAIIKLVTAYTGFINTLLNTSLYLQKTGDAKLEKALKADIVATFDENAFVNMQKFYNKVNADELTNWLRILSLNSSRLSKGIKQTDSKFNILCSTLTESLIHPLTSTQAIAEFFAKLEAHDFMYNAIVHGFFNKMYIATDAEIDNMKVDKMRIALDYIVKDLENREIGNELELFWLANSERVNPGLNLRVLLEKRFKKNPELKEKVLTNIRENYEGFKGFLFSRDGLFNKDQNKSETSVNFCTMLVKYGVFEVLTDIQLFIKAENFTDSAEIEKFEEDIKGTEFEIDVKQYATIMNKLGVTEYKPPVAGSKTSDKTAVPKGGKTGKGPVGAAVKKGGKEAPQKPKQQYMDQEELAKHQQEVLKKKMAEYLRVVARILKKILRLRDPEITKEYFEKCHGHLKELAAEEVARGPVEGVLYVLLSFAPYKPIVRASEYVVRVYFCSLCEIEIEDEEVTENFVNGFKVIKELEFNKIDANYANIIYESCQYILVSENIDNKLKSHALGIIIKIGTTGDSNELGSEILQMMIDYLDSINQYSETQSLFTFLLDKFADNVADSLFSYILDYVDNAKILALKSLNSVNKPELLNNFERNLKLRILALDENQTIVNLSNELLAKHKFEITAKHIEDFDLSEFVNVESNDSIEKFCKVSAKIIAEVPAAASIIVQKSIEAAEKLSKNTKVEKMEDALFFLPYLVENNIPQVKEHLPKIFEIFVEQYCIESYPNLMEKTLEVGSEAIKAHGEQKGDFTLGFLEKYLDKKYSAQNNVTAIIFMGACAPFLKDKSKVKNICDKIIATANSPSDHVKKNIAKCLPALINFFENPKKIAEGLVESMQNEKDLNKIKGSAYLLSGFVKGLGAKFIEESSIMSFLEQNVEGKKVNPNIKLAIIALIQALTENLGKTFEPYFLKVLQILMNFFGEQQEDIRTTSLRCTKIMMSYLSAYGVKQVLPQLLKGIEEKTWRAKVASISVLGNMAFCAPKQLSSCLPQIVPKLAQALSDPHPTVQEKGNLALQEIGSTIKSPEISDVAEILIKALSNPYDENKKGLEVLLQTQFVHYIDTASLSLIIPIIEYGLRNRDSTLRKYASQLIGSISNLIKNVTDLDPYLNMLINALKMAICDTLSDVRAIAAKACGSLCQKLGLENAAKLIVAIQEILENADSTSIDRAGAAQAMSEITYALGKSYIDKVLPVYLANTTSNQIHIRESYIGIFAFLPAIMEDEFEPYIADVVDNIIDAISDEHETTRNLAIRVVKILIQRFGLKKTSILLDPAESGLFSPNWRRRASSVILVGEMLEILQRTERKGLSQDSEEDYMSKFSRIVTSIHILKFDASENVKHTANQIWKTYVENTPKTLRQILPALVDKLIYIIAEVEENVDMAEVCIHEFGGKYAESMFRDIFSHLESKKKQLADNSPGLKALCQLLDSLVDSMNDDFVEGKKDNILSLIKDLLITSDDYIRASACQVLQTLLSKCRRSNLIEDIVPVAFKELEKLNENDPEYEDYLKFFDEIIRFELETHLEYLGEVLFESPLTQYKLDIITNNAEVFGPEIYQDGFFFNSIDFLFEELLKKKYDENLKESIVYCINQLSIHLDEDKISQFFHSCYQLIESRHLKTEKEKVYYGLEVLHFYFHNTSHDFFEHIQTILINISNFLTSTDEQIISDVNEILKSIFNSLEQEQCYEVIKPLNQCIENALQLGTKNAATTINAFNVEEGLDPYLNVIVKSLVYGPIDIFDITLTTYEYILEYTEKKALEEYVLKLVGPLIRVAFYKYENEVKSRVIATILKFEEKGLSLLNLLPQLQTTFVRMIGEFNGEKSFLRSVCDGLQYVIDNSKKRDFLLNDLLTKYLTAENDWKKFAYLFVIYRVIKKNPKLFSKALLDKLSDKLQGVKDLVVGSDQNKYLSRIYGLLVSLEVITKQKDVLTAFLDKLDNPSDKDYLIFGKFMSVLIFCDGKIMETLDMGVLEKKISGFMKGIKAKNNVLYGLQDIKKLKESDDKLKSKLGQTVIDNNSFKDIYSHLTREEQVEELISML